jgi:hypothetical protein
MSPARSRQAPCAACEGAGFHIMQAGVRKKIGDRDVRWLGWLRRVRCPDCDGRGVLVTRTPTRPPPPEDA